MSGQSKNEMKQSKSEIENERVRQYIRIQVNLSTRLYKKYEVFWKRNFEMRQYKLCALKKEKLSNIVKSLIFQINEFQHDFKVFCKGFEYFNVYQKYLEHSKFDGRTQKEERKESPEVNGEGFDIIGRKNNKAKTKLKEFQTIRIFIVIMHFFTNNRTIILISKNYGENNILIQKPQMSQRNIIRNRENKNIFVVVKNSTEISLQLKMFSYKWSKVNKNYIVNLVSQKGIKQINKVKYQIKLLRRNLKHYKVNPYQCLNIFKSQTIINFDQYYDNQHVLYNFYFESVNVFALKSFRIQIGTT
ncbi:unnamed protein product [Paramecium octaurelia]|uniref:Uncharacterized protein n=1 Tax=Paramecium octaurelia TaxID=43137 RepID=A0A8S1VNV4_PAROT|nr:unnamed protein product [Paramecium octaurelia]